MYLCFMKQNVKDWLITIVFVIISSISIQLMTSCVKKPKDVQLSITYKFTQNGSAKMVCAYGDIIDTTYLKSYSKTITVTAAESVYPHHTLTYGLTGKLINDISTTDTIQTFIYINGVLKGTGNKSGHDDYFTSTCNASFSW